MSYWHFPTKVGTFFIRPKDGRFAAMFGDEALGSYHRPAQAAEELAGGHTFTPSCGDTARLRISAELEDWHFVA
jgi:hypothetical protein